MPPYANFLSSLWRWIAPPAEDEVSPPSGPVVPGPGPFPPREAGRFAPIRQAVERRLQDLVCREIPDHLQVARHDAMDLHYLEIEPSAAGADLLQAFFEEFTPAARQEWVRGLIGSIRQVRLDGFVGVFGTADLPDTGHLDRHAQILAQGAASDYRVHLYARWVREAVAPAGPRPGCPALFDIRDAQGRRMERRANYPLTVGRGGACDVVVTGRFVSGEHFVLHSDGHKIWLEDRSRNGTWIDGLKAPAGQRVELRKPGCRLKLGREQGEAGDSPEILLNMDDTVFDNTVQATPIAPSGATPVAVPATGGVLAVLAVRDATGELLKDVLDLPYAIGRGSGQNYVVPAANAGVSGEHLVIERLTAEGAEVFNKAAKKNGTALAGELQPERFFWPYGAEVQLAPRWSRELAVKLVLKRP